MTSSSLISSSRNPRTARFELDQPTVGSGFLPSATSVIQQSIVISKPPLVTSNSKNPCSFSMQGYLSSSKCCWNENRLVRSITIKWMVFISLIYVLELFGFNSKTFNTTFWDDKSQILICICLNPILLDITEKPRSKVLLFQPFKSFRKNYGRIFYVSKYFQKGQLVWIFFTCRLFQIQHQHHANHQSQRCYSLLPFSDLIPLTPILIRIGQLNPNETISGFNNPKLM